MYQTAEAGLGLATAAQPTAPSYHSWTLRGWRLRPCLSEESHAVRSFEAVPYAKIHADF